MREILFRGKRIANDEWVEGYLYITRDGECEIGHYNPKAKIERWTGVVDPETVGQYTGLKDKNGKRIFEGDVVKVEYTGTNSGLDGIGEVLFENCKFALLWGHKKEVVCLTHFCNVRFEVIGNIYENSELLEKEKKDA